MALDSNKLVAGATRLELATSAVTGQRRRRRLQAGFDSRQDKSGPKLPGFDSGVETPRLPARLCFLAGVALLLAAFTLNDHNVRVVDGDSIVVLDQRVRLWGIDAPERDQSCADAQGNPYACGMVATAHLSRLVLGKPIECWVEDTDRYGRLVATCTAGAADLGEAMVRDGWAIDYARYSKGAYREVEAEARAARRGIHQGAFQNPEEFRRQKGGAR